MSAKQTKREAKKKKERLLSRAASTYRRRVKKAEYYLYEGARKEFKKGGSIHDVFFHLMLKDVAFAARFLNAYLPKKLRDALNLTDLDKIKVLSTDFYDKRIKKHVADLIFVIPSKKENEYLALTLIVEHKAQSGASIDRTTIMQTVKYVVLEVETKLRDKELPSDAIIHQPLVVLFYTGSDASFEAPSWETTFPLPEWLQGEEFQKAQIRFEPLCVNLTRLFLENKLSDEDFLRVMPEAMTRASLKRLKESYSTLFSSLGQIDNWTDEDKERLDACANYVALAVDEPMTEEEYESLAQSVSNEGVKENMKTIFDLAEERGEARGKIEGKIEGEIKGEIKTISMIASLRFQETSRRLTRLLKQLNDLKLLNKTCQFALTAPSLLEVENFVESLTQARPKRKRVVKKQAL